MKQYQFLIIISMLWGINTFNERGFPTFITIFALGLQIGLIIAALYFAVKDINLIKMEIKKLEADIEHIQQQRKYLQALSTNSHGQ